MSTAFKEWAVICEALGNGQQSIIIRKGGIAEGRAGFAFKHEEFLLFPTFFHEQLAKTTLPPETLIPEPSEEETEIRYAAAVEWTQLVTDLGLIAKLREFHVLQHSEVEARFHYDEPEGVHVAFVRIYRLEPSIQLKNEKKYGGCRSWLDLPESEGVALVSVLSDEEHTRRRELLKGLLGL
jgi:hypothetical protein